MISSYESVAVAMARRTNSTGSSASRGRRHGPDHPGGLLLRTHGARAQLVDGGLEVLDEDGRVVATEGERLRVGGGEKRSGRGRRVRALGDGTDRSRRPRKCGDLYWIVSPC
jgi:hypothetical protein